VSGNEWLDKDQENNDIWIPTKSRLVRTFVFPVAMTLYGWVRDMDAKQAGIAVV